MNRKTNIVVVLITTHDLTEAQRIAGLLLSERVAACVNIVPAVQSSFWWQGKIDSADESLLVVKTREKLLDELTEIVKKNHSYDVPEIIALPIIGGNEDYLNWIDEETCKESP